MSMGPDSSFERSSEDLSALVDGELQGSAVARACAQWRSDASSRSDWHLYHLIGDVLRSEDLATDSARDAAFLDGLRSRLAAEPVVLAPEPLPSQGGVDRAERRSRRGRWSWMGASAVAAGFVAVGGVLVVTRSPVPLPAVQPDASVAVVAPSVLPPQNRAMPLAADVRTMLPRVEPESLVANGKFIRDAGLDRYLDAHKHFAGSAALGVPSTYLRSATVDASGR